MYDGDEYGGCGWGFLCWEDDVGGVFRVGLKCVLLYVGNGSCLFFYGDDFFCGDDVLGGVFF